MRTSQTERRRRSAAVRLVSISDSDSDQAPSESDAQAQRDTDALLGPADDPLRQATVPGVPGMKLGCVLFTLVEREVVQVARRSSASSRACQKCLGVCAFPSVACLHAYRCGVNSIDRF